MIYLCISSYILPSVRSHVCLTAQFIVKFINVNKWWCCVGDKVCDAVWKTTIWNVDVERDVRKNCSQSLLSSGLCDANRSRSDWSVIKPLPSWSTESFSTFTAWVLYKWLHADVAERELLLHCAKVPSLWTSKVFQSIPSIHYHTSVWLHLRIYLCTGEPKQ